MRRRFSLRSQWSGRAPRSCFGFPGPRAVLACGLIYLWHPLVGLADTAGIAPAIDSPASLPLSDEQDRLLPSRLEPSADNLVRATALYAEAVQGETARDPQQTLDQLRAVVALDPHFPAAQVKVSDLLLQLGYTDQALALLQQAVANNPGALTLQSALAYAERLRGDDPAAAKLALHVLALDATPATPIRVVLQVAQDQGDLGAGLNEIEALFRSGPAPAPAAAWLQLARLYVEVARGEMSPTTEEQLLQRLLPIYEAAAALPPANVETLMQLADTYRDLGQKSDALRALRQAVALEPENGDLLLRRADLENNLGLRAAALNDCELAYALNPTTPDLRERLAAMEIDAGHYSDAIRLLEEALSDAPNETELLVNLGIAYEGSGHTREANDCFARCFQALPATPQPYIDLALYQLSRHQVDQAGTTLDAALVRFPGSARLRFYTAVQARYAKNYSGALAALARMQALAVGAESNLIDAEYYLEEALTLDLAGRADEAQPVLQEGIERFPDDADLLNELAYRWADAGDHLDQAMALSRRALRLDGESGAIQDTYGWILYRQGDALGALPYLQRAAVSTNNDPVVLRHLVQVEAKLGHRQIALATLRLALRKDPKNMEIAHLLTITMAQFSHGQLRSIGH